MSKVIPHVYEKIDGYIGEITKASGPGTNVVIMSDHGGGPIERVVVLNNWLSERGYLTTQTTSINHNLKIGIYRMVKKLFPKNIKKKLKKAFPEMKSKLSSFLILSGINWGATKAVAEGFYGSIYINTIGEKPLGIVNAEDYDSVCDKIINELKGLVDPKTGASPIRDIYKKKKKYVINPHGIPDKYYVSKLVPPTFDGKRELKVLYAGRLLSIKGAHIIVEAMKHTSKHISLTILGNEDETGYVEKLRSIIEANSLKNVVFKSQVHRDTLISLFKDFDLIVFPSIDAVLNANSIMKFLKISSFVNPL